MRKKSKILLLAILLLNTVNIPNVYAFTVDTQFAKTSNNTQNKEPTLTEGKGFEDTITTTNGTTTTTTTYTCSYKYTTSSTTSVSVNGYNNEKSILEESNKVASGDEIIAGTAIGLKIVETKTIEYHIKEFTVSKKITKTTSGTTSYNCTCTYRYSRGTPMSYNLIASLTSLSKVTPPDSSDKCPSNDHQNNKTKKCEEKENCIIVGESCTKQTTSGGSTTTGPYQVDGQFTGQDKEEYDNCKDAALKEVKGKLNGEPSFKVVLQNSNYTEEEKENNEVYSISGKLTNGATSCTLKDSEEFNASKTCTYTYSLQKACVNRKTSLVSYKEKCNSNEEIEAKPTTNVSGVWNYFTPLSTKSNQSIELSLMPNDDDKDNKISVEECLYVMQNNNSKKSQDMNYTSLIKPDINTTFKGDALGCGTDEECIKKKSDYKKVETNKGCYLAINVKIPVKQKFYHEETTKEGSTVSIKFKGFNFYYRQIDYTNPFPNGLDKTSYWYDWYKSKNKNPDISKSFSTITYKTKEIDTTTIREYNDTYPYTSWSNMNIDGTSQFITDDIFDTKRNITTNWYQLGCGPANAGKTGCETK